MWSRKENYVEPIISCIDNSFISALFPSSVLTQVSQPDSLILVLQDEEVNLPSRHFLT